MLLCAPNYCLRYGAITRLIDKTLLREIYELNLNFLTFSQSKTVISFIILLVLQILSLSLKLNICIHKNNQFTFLVIYHLL